MTTCVVVNPFMMGVNPRQSYQSEQEGKVMNGELMDFKQVHDNSYWYPAPSQAHPTATSRTSRSALRALLQQPPPLSLVPDTRSESYTVHDGGMLPSWPPFPEQVDFQNRTVCSSSDSLKLPQHSGSLQTSQHQVGHQGFDNLQHFTSKSYHVHYSDRSGERQQLPVAGGGLLSQEQSELEQLHKRQVLQRERIARHDFPAPPRIGSSSLTKEIEKMRMMTVAQQQMNKIRLERRRYFDQDHKQLLLPEGAGGSKLKFGITADGIRNGPENHPVLHSQQRQQQQQQQTFSRGFVSPANQQHDQDLNTTTKGSPTSTFSTETKMHIDDAEAMVMKQFQEKVCKLDIGTRLNLQQSLHRLARSARERREEMRTSTQTSAEPDYHRPDSMPQSRVQIETETNPVDRTLMNMMFSPLRLPGQENPLEHRPHSFSSPRPSSRPVAAGSSQGNWGWSTSTGPKSNKWCGTPVHPGANSGNMGHAQFHGRGGSGAVPQEAPTTRTVTPLTPWIDSPPLTDSYSSPGSSSSPVDPSMLDRRQTDINLTYRGSVTTARQLGPGGNRSTTMQPVNILAPRSCDSQSTITSDHSYSSSHGGQALQHYGFHGPSSYSSQEAGGFVSGGQNMNIAAGNHGVDQHPTNLNFSMMNTNADILAAATSMENRPGVDHIDRFHPQLPSAASHNSNAKNVTVGFSPLPYDDGSHFESGSPGRNLGDNSASSGMSIFDQRSSAIMRNMARHHGIHTIL